MTFFDYRSVTNASQVPADKMEEFKYNKILDGLGHTLDTWMKLLDYYDSGKITVNELLDQFTSHVAFKTIFVGGLMAIRDAEREKNIDSEVQKFSETLKDAPEAPEL